MLSTIYRMLVLNLGVPPTEFTWTEYNAKGEPVSTETYTPLSFTKKYGDEKLIDNYVMLMNDPSREYYKCYEIDYDRHRYDGKTGRMSISPSRISKKWLFLLSRIAQ